jgi:cyclopropane-fatty-acyl-phospholipid synthase
VLERIASTILERALAHLEGGTLQVRLPGSSTTRSFGSGPAVNMAIHDRRFFRRVATRGKVGIGESYTAGEWDSDALVAFFEILLRNSAAAAERHARVRRLM